MAHLVLAIYLIVLGLNILVGVGIPPWILGLLALVAGGLLLAERFGITAKRP